jgi:glycosyltransferase involved in cell wall biosynthesis
VVDVAEVGNGYSAQVVHAARRAGIPSVVTVLETHPGRIWDLLPPFSLYTRYALRHATVFRVLTARSEAYLRQLGVAQDRIVRIPVGIDTELFHPASGRDPEGEIRLLFARRLEPKNGLALELQAFAELHGRFPQLRLWVAGDGPSRGLVEAAARTMPMRFLGRVPYPALAEVYRGADVFCNPAMDSRRLGQVVHEDGQYTFPLLESQASGLAVVSSASGSNAELLAPSNPLVPQGDVRALVAAIARLIEGPRRAAQARENRQWVEERFSAAAWQPEMDALVHRLGG